MKKFIKRYINLLCLNILMMYAWLGLTTRYGKTSFISTVLVIFISILFVFLIVKVTKNLIDE